MGNCCAKSEKKQAFVKFEPNKFDPNRSVRMRRKSKLNLANSAPGNPTNPKEDDNSQVQIGPSPRQIRTIEDY